MSESDLKLSAQFLDMATIILPRIGEIKARRRKLGISQTQLAKEAGVSQSLVAKIESDRVAPSYDAVQKIFEVLNRHEVKVSLKARDIMTRGHLVSVDKKDKVSKAARLMKQRDLSQLPVLDGKRVVGSVSEKVILDKTLELGVDVVSKLPIEDVMVDPFPRVAEDTPIDAIMALLKHNWGVLVTKKDDIIGIVTTADLLKVI